MEAGPSGLDPILARQVTADGSIYAPVSVLRCDCLQNHDPATAHLAIWDAWSLPGQFCVVFPLRIKQIEGCSGRVLSLEIGISPLGRLLIHSYEVKHLMSGKIKLMSSFPVAYKIGG